MRDWKRYEEAKRLRAIGLTMKDTGMAIGVSAGRVREMLRILERRDQQLAREAADQSLVPWWRGLKQGTVWDLEDRGFHSREACMALAADELTIWRGAVALPGYEEDKDYWRWSSKKRLTLALVNEVRIWLGAAPYVPKPRTANAAKLKRHGYHL